MIRRVLTRRERIPALTPKLLKVEGWHPVGGSVRLSGLLQVGIRGYVFQGGEITHTKAQQSGRVESVLGKEATWATYKEKQKKTKTNKLRCQSQWCLRIWCSYLLDSSSDVIFSKESFLTTPCNIPSLTVTHLFHEMHRIYTTCRHLTCNSIVCLYPPLEWEHSKGIILAHSCSQVPSAHREGCMMQALSKHLWSEQVWEDC